LIGLVKEVEELAELFLLLRLQLIGLHATLTCQHNKQHLQDSKDRGSERALGSRPYHVERMRQCAGEEGNGGTGQREGEGRSGRRAMAGLLLLARNFR
jgi:hypothetical protein